MSERDGQRGAPTHLVKYGTDRAILRLVEPVTNRSIFWLCDEVDLAIDYYCYRWVDIHIDSPGGEVTALEYFMTRLDDWRAIDGLVLGTLALTEAASAAAVLLSLGTVGHRRASPSARLLYHDARIITQDPAVWTQVKLETYQRALADTDRRLLRTLAGHIAQAKLPMDGGPLSIRRVAPDHREGPLRFTDAEVHSEDELVEIYDELTLRDLFMTPKDAVGMHLIDQVATA